mgnify:CR=1 FL=1
MLLYNCVVTIVLSIKNKTFIYHETIKNIFSFYIMGLRKREQKIESNVINSQKLINYGSWSITIIILLIILYFMYNKMVNGKAKGFFV